jgi:HEXXH motif-containing protein
MVHAGRARARESGMLEPARDLTLPEPGSTTTRRVLGAYLRRVLDDLLAIPIGRFRSQVFDDFADTRAIIERLLRQRRTGPVFAMLRRPTHSTLIRCLHAELWGEGDVAKLDGSLAELTTLLAFELAQAGELPPDGIRLRERPLRLLSVGANLSVAIDTRWRLGLKPGRLVLESDGGRVDLEIAALAAGTVPLPDGVSVERPYHSIRDGLVLACADNNPLAQIEAHPLKSGNALDLGAQPLEAWTGALDAALTLVEEHLPELAAEIRLVMQLLIPVGHDEEQHLSASYAEAIGSAYLSLHPDPMTMAEALIHEFSHNKLNALCALGPVLENAFSPLFASPVRPDPRPLHGILLAVHAFVPVARLYETMLEARHPLSASDGFERRLRQVVAGNHEGFATLRQHARAAPAGAALLDELAGWDRHFASWR